MTSTDRVQVAVVAPPQTREDCFEPADWARLERCCLVAYVQSAKWDEAEAAEVMAGAHVVLTGWGSGALTEAVLAPAPELKLWVHSAGSMATMATPAVFDRGVLMSTANDVLARGVAEFALGMTLMALKQVVALNRDLHAGVPWREARGKHNARELCDLRVGIAGFGRVGRHLARLLESFNGLDVVVSDPFVDESVLKGHGVTRVSLEELCATSTVVHNCVPWTERTVGLFTRELFRSMPDGAVYLNTGRGATVDEAALIEELQTGRISACLDVTYPEPPAEGSPFYSLPNCILTPHIAGAVANGRRLLGRFAVDEVLRFIDGRPLVGQLSRRDVEGMTGGKG
jgi:phosphoglycerate dehydrogenase-like enzyme